MAYWNDVENLKRTDCPLCAGAGFYEVDFEWVYEENRRRVRKVTGCRAYGSGLSGRRDGYRMLTRCHSCNEESFRGVPEEIVYWKDDQVDNLLSLDTGHGEGEPPF